LPEGEDVITPRLCNHKKVTAAGREFLNVFNDEHDHASMHDGGLTALTVKNS